MAVAQIPSMAERSMDLIAWMKAALETWKAQAGPRMDEKGTQPIIRDALNQFPLVEMLVS